MALSKDIKSKFGINATYWRIVSINTNFDDEITTVLLFGYTDEDTRITEKGGEVMQPLEQLSVSLDATDVADREIAYTKLKEHETFVNAENI